MNQYTEDNIINTGWHQFIYGYNTKERTNFLKEITVHHPITLNRDCPQAIYIDNFSLPIIDSKCLIDKNLLSMVSRNYFDFTIYHQLLLELLNLDCFKELGGRDEIFLEYVNRLIINDGFDKIQSLESLKDCLLQAKNFYQEKYISLLTGTDFKKDIDDLIISSIFMRERYIKKFKEMINNKSYFVVIIDHKNSIPLISAQAINGYISMRCTADISMKIACDPSEWSSYYDLDGNFIENPHDYSIIELDQSLKEYTRIKKEKFYNKL